MSEKLKLCDCHSYNAGYGNRKEVVVEAPPGYGKEKICLDACIAETIKELWSRGIHTSSSCCGHGRLNPSIVLCDAADEALAEQCKNILDEIDPRPWEISYWKRVIHTRVDMPQAAQIEGLDEALEKFKEAFEKENARVKYGNENFFGMNKDRPKVSPENVLYQAAKAYRDLSGA